MTAVADGAQDRRPLLDWAWGLVRLDFVGVNGGQQCGERHADEEQPPAGQELPSSSRIAKLHASVPNADLLQRLPSKNALGAPLRCRCAF